MSYLNILGIDPSLRNFGMVHASLDVDVMELEVGDLILAQPPEIDKHLKKVTRKNSDDLRRARHLQQALQMESEKASIAIVEVPVGSQSARAMASYGICVGVLASCNIPMIEVTPSEVKLAAVNSKTATKAEMIEWAIERHPEAKWLMRKSKGELIPTNANEHLADALAAIYAGMVTEQFLSAVVMMRSARLK